MSLVTFSLSGALLTFTLCSPPLAWVYCALGCCRVIVQRGRLLAAWMLLALAEGLLSFVPGPWPCYANALLVLVSELCWLRSVHKVLEEWFEWYVLLFFFYLGVLLTYGFYPLLLAWGPALLESKELQETVHKVVADAAASAEGGSLAGDAPTRIAENPLGALTQAVPLVVVLIGTPLVALVFLIYYWLCRNMPRMLLMVLGSFFLWMGIFLLLSLAHIPIAGDVLGKGLLVTVCIIMVYSLVRLTSYDWEVSQGRVLHVSLGFGLSLVLDWALGAREGTVSCQLLFLLLIGVKQAMATLANAAEDAGESYMAKVLPKHFLPLRPLRGPAPGLEVPMDSSTGSPADNGVAVPLTALNA